MQELVTKGISNHSSSFQNILWVFIAATYLYTNTNTEVSLCGQKQGHFDYLENGNWQFTTYMNDGKLKNILILFASLKQTRIHKKFKYNIKKAILWASLPVEYFNYMTLNFLLKVLFQRHQAKWNSCYIKIWPSFYSKDLFITEYPWAQFSS